MCGVLAALALGACASLPRDAGEPQTAALLQARVDAAPAWTDTTPPIPDTPLASPDAIRLAFQYNPRIRQAQARLGLGRADVAQAARIGNPRFGYSHLTSAVGSQITRTWSLGLAELLLLPARKRFATADFERVQYRVAGELMDLAQEVEIAWLEALSAAQVASLRDLVAQAAEHSAELAQRYFDAGNIDELQLQQEYAAAGSARVAAARASAAAVRARSKLGALMGLPTTAAWTTLDELPAPPTTPMQPADLLVLARAQRLDLAAARAGAQLHTDALGVQRRWRWLGTVDVGYDDEHDTSGERLRGPTLELELPLFDQGQGRVARAESEQLDARAQLAALELGVQSDVGLGLEQLESTRAIAERYRLALLPRRERIVARMQERTNFMLVGVFELLLAKQQQYDGYQEYLEAVRDYWIARAQLRHAVGGRLPDDDAPVGPAVGVEAILPDDDAPAMDHSKMDHGAHAPGDAP